jgi:BRCA1/BRCA2-containing complex subunit 3
MCLLYGDFQQVKDDWIVKVQSIAIAQRSDKRKDRVEISPEVLSQAMNESSDLGMNIVGWFHSHPHITALPSHVDLRTQSSLQLLDERFLGMIISCYNKDKDKRDRVQVMCFQANGSEMVEIPMIIEPCPLSKDILKQFVRLSAMLVSEERSNYLSANGVERSDELMEFSPTFRSVFASEKGPVVNGKEMERLHSSSLYSQNLTEVMDRVIAPSITMLNSFTR